MRQRGSPPPPALIVAGPTASGKSALALALARRLDGVVINADSMQVYRDLRVLTARPTPAEEALAPPDAEALQRLRQLQAAAAEGDAAKVKSLLTGLGAELLGAARHRAWTEAARRYDFQKLEDSVRSFMDQARSLA